MANKLAKLPIDVKERELLRLDNQLCFQIYRASRAMTQMYRPLLKALGLTYPQYLVMLVLWEKQDLAGQDSQTVATSFARCNVSELGEHLRLDSGTLSPLLKRLQQQGLISRERNLEDERQLDVALTKQGITLSKKAAQVPLKLLCDLDVPVDNLVALKQQLEQLMGNMDNAKSL